MDTDQFLTAASILTFGGATVAVWAVGNTLRLALKVAAPWVPLVVALVISFAIAARGDLLADALGWVVSAVNGCLLFLSAAGLQQASLADVRGQEGAHRQGAERVSWGTPWIRLRGVVRGPTAPPDETTSTH